MCWQKRGRAHDVRADEFARAVYRTVDVGFRRKMENRVRPEEGERAEHRVGVAYVGLEEMQPARHPEARFEICGRNHVLCGIEAGLFQGLRHARVGQLVDDEHLGVRLAHEEADEGAADEPGGARYDATPIPHR